MQIPKSAVVASILSLTLPFPANQSRGGVGARDRSLSLDSLQSYTNAPVLEARLLRVGEPERVCSIKRWTSLRALTIKDKISLIADREAGTLGIARRRLSAGGIT